MLLCAGVGVMPLLSAGLPLYFFSFKATHASVKALLCGTVQI